MGDNLITPQDLLLYQTFVAEQQADFRRIAKATKNEYSAEDISQQALLIA